MDGVLSITFILYIVNLQIIILKKWFQFVVSNCWYLKVNKLSSNVVCVVFVLFSVIWGFATLTEFIIHTKQATKGPI